MRDRGGGTSPAAAEGDADGADPRRGHRDSGDRALPPAGRLSQCAIAGYAAGFDRRGGSMRNIYGAGNFTASMERGRARAGVPAATCGECTIVNGVDYDAFGIAHYHLTECLGLGGDEAWLREPGAGIGTRRRGGSRHRHRGEHYHRLGVWGSQPHAARGERGCGGEAESGPGHPGVQAGWHRGLGGSLRLHRNPAGHWCDTLAWRDAAASMRAWGNVLLTLVGAGNVATVYADD